MHDSGVHSDSLCKFPTWKRYELRLQGPRRQHGQEGPLVLRLLVLLLQTWPAAEQRLPADTL